MNITAKLSPDEVNKIIKDYLEKEGYKVTKIEAKVGTRTVGHQMNEYEQAYFECIEANISKDDTSMIHHITKDNL